MKNYLKRILKKKFDSFSELNFIKGLNSSIDPSEIIDLSKKTRLIFLVLITHNIIIWTIIIFNFPVIEISWTMLFDFFLWVLLFLVLIIFLSLSLLSMLIFREIRNILSDKTKINALKLYGISSLRINLPLSYDFAFKVYYYILKLILNYLFRVNSKVRIFFEQFKAITEEKRVSMVRIFNKFYIVSIYITVITHFLIFLIL